MCVCVLVQSHNHGKLQTCVLEQLRVVCRGVTYPLWIPGTHTHIRVTVLETVPDCQEGSGLLLTERSEMELLPRGAGSPSPGSAGKEGPSHPDSTTTSARSGSGRTHSSEDTGGDSGKQSRFWNLLNMGAVDGAEAGTQAAGLAQYLSSFLPFAKDQRSLRQNPLPPDGPQQAMGKEPRRSNKSLSGGAVALSAGRGMERVGQVRGHRKQPSLPARLEGEPEVVERLTSEYINTPRMTVSLRVQPGAQLSRPGCKQCAEGRVPHMLDAMVHPATLPEVFHSALLVRGQRGSASRVNFLVRVKLLPFVEPFGQETTGGNSRPESASPLAAAPPSVDSVEGKSVSAASTAPPTTVPPALVVRLVLQGTLHPLPTLSSSEAPSPVESSVDSEEEPEGSSDRELDWVPASSLPKPLSHRHFVTRETSCAPIVPGHVVLSDMVRRQLGVGLYRRVQLSEVLESHKHICLRITLQPLKDYKVGRGLAVCGGCEP